MAICWERAVPLTFHLCCSLHFSAVLVVRVPFPFGVWGRVWNSIVSIPDHCHFIYLLSLVQQSSGTLADLSSGLYFLNNLELT